MKKLFAVLLVLSIAVSLFAGCSGKKEEANYETFAAYTDLEIFQNVPAINMEKTRVADAAEYGDQNFVLALKGTFKADYDAYLKTLESAGYTKYADNGDGIDGTTFAAYYQKDDVVLNVAFNHLSATTYISASKNAKLTPHLINDPSFTEGNIDGAKTTLVMHQVPEYGNCFVIQLKNGHYIVNDGGRKDDLKILLTYLIDNTPEGQKPVVDAWFISHEHDDHSGIFEAAMTSFDLHNIAVEGIYYSRISDAAKAAIGESAHRVGIVSLYSSYFKNAAGEETPVYRSHLGDKYYFNDIVVEVPYTQEQFQQSRYVDNLNASSLWLMYNIEGQKFLLSGDTEIENMRDVSMMYDQSYMDVDIMSLHHHSLNVYTDDLGYFNVETMLYSTWGTYSIYWPKETLEHNLEIQEKYCQEYVSYMEGGIKITFPYTVGSYEILDPWYPDATEYCIERQNGWLKAAGLL